MTQSQWRPLCAVSSGEKSEDGGGEPPPAWRISNVLAPIAGCILLICFHWTQPSEPMATSRPGRVSFGQFGQQFNDQLDKTFRCSLPVARRAATRRRRSPALRRAKIFTRRRFRAIRRVAFVKILEHNGYGCKAAAEEHVYHTSVGSAGREARAVRNVLRDSHGPAT